jgi:hypothetical protein
MHLHRFEMRGRKCVLSREGGLFFETSARKKPIGGIQTPRVVRLRVRRDWPAPGRTAILADGGRVGSTGKPDLVMQGSKPVPRMTDDKGYL